MHRVTSRILIGPEICRNNDYLNQSMEFTESIFVNGLALTMMPMGPLRKIISWIFSFRHRQKLKKIVKLLLPIVERRLYEFQNSVEIAHNLDAMDWTIELTKSVPVENMAHRITLHLLHNLWAGSAAPSGLVTQMVFQMLMEPMYLEPLRAEAEEAISSKGWSDKALKDMPLQDSFIREINRVYPTGAGSYETSHF